MVWWMWMVLGAVFLGVEMFAIDAQFYLVFLGVAAGLVGLAGLLGIVMPEWVQWASFAVLALIFMFTFRRSLYEKVHGNVVGFSSSMAGESLTVSVDLAPGDDARQELHGTEWTVRNVGESGIANGSRARIVKVDGLTLHISAD